ncbi:MAG: hypothetical protein K940chlam6_01755 [Chlamydiae bacterium]|nr:hypothetical protein [Chlamydiota bacterium]
MIQPSNKGFGYCGSESPGCCFHVCMGIGLLSWPGVQVSFLARGMELSDDFSLNLLLGTLFSISLTYFCIGAGIKISEWRKNRQINVQNPIETTPLNHLFIYTKSTE